MVISTSSFVSFGAMSSFFKDFSSSLEAGNQIPKRCDKSHSGVNIPKIFEFYNDKVVSEISKIFPQAVLRYSIEFGFPAEQRANNCVECGECVKACPQQINIPEQSKKPMLN